jgi:hypothetical protein
VFANHVSQALEHVRGPPLPHSFKNTPSTNVAKEMAERSREEPELEGMRKLGEMIVLGKMLWKRRITVYLPVSNKAELQYCRWNLKKMQTRWPRHLLTANNFVYRRCGQYRGSGC